MTDRPDHHGGSRRRVAVFGSSAPRPGDDAYEQARGLGRDLAAAGFDLINGGHEGIMEAVSRGAREGGGAAIGVSCAEIRRARDARTNAYLSRLVDADSLVNRIDIMMRSASGYVFLPGGTGTLAELGLIAEHLHKGLIARRPMVCLGSSFKPVFATIEAASGQMHDDLVQWADSPAQVVAIMTHDAIPTAVVEQLWPEPT